MTDPLTKYVRGSGTTQYYDCEAMAADLREFAPIIQAVAELAEADVVAGGSYYDDLSVHPVIAAYQQYAVRRYREGV